MRLSGDEARGGIRAAESAALAKKGRLLPLEAELYSGIKRTLYSGVEIGAHDEHKLRVPCGALVGACGARVVICAHTEISACDRRFDLGRLFCVGNRDLGPCIFRMRE